MRKSLEFYSGSNHETESSPERTRDDWQSIGNKILESAQPEPQLNEASIKSSPSDVSHDTLSTSNTPAERFHEPATADEAELLKGMDSYRKEQNGFLRGERAQELSEREFNERLSTLEELEAASGQDGVSKRFVEYNGQRIPVYDLTGYPYRFLQHVASYKLTPNADKSTPGFVTAQRLMEDPSLWMRKESEIANDSNTDAGQYANTLATTYIDTEINTKSGAVDTQGVTYGLLSVRPDSIIALGPGDLGSSSKAGKNRPTDENSFEFSPDNLAKNSIKRYNEVLLRRYNEDGEPPAPDFLVVHNNDITEYTKRHAAYFNVPIINIEDQPYLDKQNEKIVAQIESLNNESSYDEIFKTLYALEQSSPSLNSLWKENIYTTPHPGDKPSYQHLLDKLPQNIRAKTQDLIEVVEPTKRLEMLDEALTQATSELIQNKGQNIDISPFYIQRKIKHNRNAQANDQNPSTSASSIHINYKYPLEDGTFSSIVTNMDSTDAAYDHFSQLIDTYETNGGVVLKRTQ